MNTFVGGGYEKEYNIFSRNIYFCDIVAEQLCNFH